MASQLENLGFEARIDVDKARAAIGKLEAGLRSLARTVGAVGREKIAPPDDRSFGRGVGQMEASLRKLGSAGSDAARLLQREMDTMASLTSRRADAMAKGVSEPLDKLDRKIQQVQQRIRALQQQMAQAPNPRAFGGGPTAPGGAGGPGGGAMVVYQPPGALAHQPGGGAAGLTQGLMSGMLGTGAQAAGGAAGMAAGTTAGAASGNPLMAAAMGVAGGLVAGKLAHQIMGFVTGAVAQASEEYVRETNLFSRSRGVTEAGIGVDQMAGLVHGAGRKDLFTRGETTEAYEAFASRAGTPTREGLTGMLGFTRAFGLTAGATAGQFGRLGGAGGLADRDAARTASLLASSIEKSGMMERTEEAMEASVGLLERMADDAGKPLAEKEVRGLLAFQTALAATGNPQFQGQRGARIMGGLMDGMSEGATNERIDTMITQAIVRHPEAAGLTREQLDKMDVQDLQEFRDTNKIGALRAFRAYHQEELGGDSVTGRRAIQQILGGSNAQAGEVYRKVFVPGAFGALGDITADQGNQVIERGRNIHAKAFDGRAEDARRINLKSEDLARAAGDAAFPAFKALQDTMLGLGNNVMNFVNPAVDAFNKLLSETAGALGVKGLNGATGFDARNTGGAGFGVFGAGGAAGGGPAPGYAPSGPRGTAVRTQPGVTTRGMHPAMVSHAADAQAAFGGDMSSGFRDPGKNKGAGGVKGSYHTRGQAFDLVGPGRERGPQIRAWAAKRGLEAIYHNAGSGYHWHFEPAPGRARQALTDPHAGHDDGHGGAGPRPAPPPAAPKPKAPPPPAKPKAQPKPPAGLAKPVDPAIFRALPAKRREELLNGEQNPFYHGAPDPMGLHHKVSPEELEWSKRRGARSGGNKPALPGSTGGAPAGKGKGDQAAASRSITVAITQTFTGAAGQPEDVKKKAKEGAMEAIAAANHLVTSMTMGA